MKGKRNATQASFPKGINRQPDLRRRTSHRLSPVTYNGSTRTRTSTTLTPVVVFVRVDRSAPDSTKGRSPTHVHTIHPSTESEYVKFLNIELATWSEEEQEEEQR
ncbi:hypothetical protein G7K_4554-t1 [Saitoella complicata NRRL Y-17804]|uniref:Uncharacterized protein n=1 Tax=Saitoella complicata (strain BCRC 22490 / CBS 7301 / JCM 7358 / NBRC 10748 / NRRL Y-17804) TaxID=698492 RepID=A0A0E9NKW0_SAICN|nr:hypothetical protein G7K_4554-t1 [Saitoella complicata NRRL Y-17804]